VALWPKVEQAIRVPTPDFLVDGPDGGTTLILAHGAGAPMDSAFMDAVARGVANEGIRVVRFEFPYMAARRTSTRRGPDREAVLLQTWRDVIEQFDAASVVIGGKSMGGRVASMVADESGVAGLVCLGYPFHAPGRPEKPRIDHLRELRTPALIVQGTRDHFGPREEVEAYPLPSTITFLWLEDGDHDFKPRSASGHSHGEHVASAIAATVAFVRLAAGQVGID
jgi:predicted alpha/beta-hydrolase family hydrolase